MLDMDVSQALAPNLVRIIKEDLLGEGERHREESEDSPKELFPAGNLGPFNESFEQMEDFRITEYVPSSLGLLFRIGKNASGNATIKGRFNVFFARRPSLKELRTQAARYEMEFPSEDSSWSNKDVVDPIRKRAIRYRPIYVRESVSFDAAMSIADIVVDGEYHTIATVPDIQGEFARISRNAVESESCLRADSKGKPPAELAGGALESQEALDLTMAKFGSRSGPGWIAELRYRAWDDPNQKAVIVELLLSNRLSAKEGKSLSDRGQDGHLFNPTLSLSVRRESVIPFELSVLQSKNYRVNSTVFSSGINCDVAEKVEVETVLIRTENLPIFEQKQKVPAAMSGYQNGAPSPSDLESDPLTHLRKVSVYLHSYSDWWKGEAFEELVNAKAVSPDVRKAFLESHGQFEKEIARFDQGLSLLSSDGQFLKAFRLMNRSFSLNPRSSVQSWRIFQLVFIVSCLPLMAERARGAAKHPIPVVLWYPTGGGKTEAYLGLAITCAFWDRLRGKRFGITAWTKFPLRLLSMQQLGRIQAAMAFADLVRIEAAEIPVELKGDSFSVGLYAGEGNSTNDLDWPNDASRMTKPTSEAAELEGASQQSRLIRKNHKIDVCPMCAYRGHKVSGKVVTTYDKSKPGFLHKCSRCEYQLPLHVTDTENVRFLPTVIVSTIDKLAELGRENCTKIFFGYAKSRCAQHGYFMGEQATCNVLGCGKKLVSVADSVDPCPEVVIQDELHFLRETLGAFDSHYETMMLSIMRRARLELGTRHGGPWNVLGSSATIEGYQEQMRELYCADEAVRFPSPGPAKGLDAYAADGKDIQRFVIGFRPQNMSHVDAVMKVLLSYHRVTLRLADPGNAIWGELGEPFSKLEPEERSRLARFYRTSLAYALLKTEAGQIHKSFVGQLNQKLEQEGLPQFEDHRLSNLTGEMDATDVSEVLRRLEQDSPEWLQNVTATSIISHGVDLDILNFMVFRGQPHTVSEWIQAMSRVGRRPGFPGIVVNVYNPNRERDAAYFTHHKRYIENADSLIRNVPITRFSVEALRKTVRGLFFNVLAYYAGPGSMYYYTDKLKVEMPKLRPMIERTLKEYYGLDKAQLTPKEARLQEALDNEIQDIKALVENPQAPQRSKEAIDPMTSLRDVDETVRLTPAYDSDFFQRD